MAPSIGKLICNNRDALHQKDEDTAAMMEMISQKRNDATNDSEDTSQKQGINQEEILEIAEAIRELAAKLQARRESFNATASNPQLNASLNRSLEHIQKSIIQTPKNYNKMNDSLAHQNLLDAFSRLQSSEDDEWLIDLETPKAGNLSLLEEKTPLHSNTTRNQTKTMKDRLTPYNGMHHNPPYPLMSNKPVPKNEVIQPRSSIADSLATLRNELSKAKTMEYHNDNHKIAKKKHPFSTRHLRSTSRSRNEFVGSISPKERPTNLIIDATNKSLGKIRSLSTGRAAQHGKQIINRILRREIVDDNTDEKTLTATSSDSTHDSTSIPGIDKGHTTISDAKIDIVMTRNAAENSKLLDQRQNERNHVLRRSGTPKNHQVVSQSHQSRSTTPFRSLQPSQLRRPMTIDASMSNVSMTSGYIASNTDQRPVKYRATKTSSEKGFEIVIPDGETNTKTHAKTHPTGESSTDMHGRTTRNNSTDRAAISQRLQHHQNAIKEKIRKDLNVTTDLHNDDDDSIPDRISKVVTAKRSSSSNNNNNNNNNNNKIKTTGSTMDSTRAVIMRHDKVIHDPSTSSTTSSIHSYVTSTSGSNTIIAINKRSSSSTQTKPRRTIIRE